MNKVMFITLAWMKQLILMSISSTLPRIVIPSRRLMNFKEINLMMISFDDHISSFIIVIIAGLAQRR